MARRAAGSCSPVQPDEGRVETQPGGGEEVPLGVLELDVGGDVLVAIGQGHHGAEPEGGVGHLVERGRPRRQHAVLDAQVGTAVRDAVATPVPAPDRAGVQAQRRQVGGLAAAEGVERVGDLDVREERREPCDVLPVELEDRAADPSVAEGDARLEVAEVMARPAGVDGLLEQGDAGLGPQPAAEQQRRVGGAGQHGPGEHLRDVVLVGERRRARPGGGPGSWRCTPRPSPSRGASGARRSP